MKKFIAVAAAIILTVCALCPAVFAEETEIKFGDVDFNGSVNSSDALMALQSSVGIITLSNEAFTAADVNADTAVNSSDALLILQHATDIITQFPAEKQEEKDPSTIPEILAFYKKVAAQNSDISTSQSFELVEFDVGKASSVLKPFAEDLIASNTMDVPGFPGDMETFSADDIISADYQRNSDGTVTVTLNVKPQSDTLEGSRYEGPTGRAVGVVGDVPKLIEDSGATKYVDISKTTGGIAYSNTVIKIVVDDSLKLVKDKCTWTYTADGHVEHLKVKVIIGLNDVSGKGTVNYKLAY